MTAQVSAQSTGPARAAHRAAMLAKDTWISRAWVLGEELERTRTVLLMAVEALAEQGTQLTFLVHVILHLCGRFEAEEPRDLAAERQAIALLLCGLVHADDVADLTWSAEHQGIVDAIERERGSEEAWALFDRGPTAWIERIAVMSYRGPDGRLRGDSSANPVRRAAGLRQALRRALEAVDDGMQPLALVEHLRRFARARQAVVPAEHAVRALRQEDAETAYSYLVTAAEILFPPQGSEQPSALDLELMREQKRSRELLEELAAGRARQRSALQAAIGAARAVRTHARVRARSPLSRAGRAKRWGRAVAQLSAAIRVLEGAL